jgi:hypothetical protein
MRRILVVLSVLVTIFGLTGVANAQTVPHGGTAVACSGSDDYGYNITQAWGQVDWESNGCNEQMRPFIKYCNDGICGLQATGGWVESLEFNSRASGPVTSSLTYFEIQIEFDGGGGRICQEIYPTKGNFHSC